MFRAFSKSGALLNHSNYILHKRRKGNGVIFIFSKEKKKKALPHSVNRCENAFGFNIDTLR